jgi:hypothetical protein
METLGSSEMSVNIWVTRRNIPEDDILHSHCRENLKSYIALTGWALYQKRNLSPVKYELGFISEKTTFFRPKFYTHTHTHPYIYRYPQTIIEWQIWRQETNYIVHWRLWPVTGDASALKCPRTAMQAMSFAVQRTVPQATATFHTSQLNFTQIGRSANLQNMLKLRPSFLTDRAAVQTPGTHRSADNIPLEILYLKLTKWSFLIASPYWFILHNRTRYTYLREEEALEETDSRSVFLKG